MRDRFRAKPDNRYRPENWEAMNERADDQIAPAAARHIDALQRWALATADIPQHGHRSNEVQMMQRIQSSYSNLDTSGASHRNPTNESEDSEPLGTATKTLMLKREHMRSPTRALVHGELHANKTAKGNAPQNKGCGEGKIEGSTKDASNLDVNDKCMQSSDWSFPSDDEVKNKTMRTYIEID
jgi:hypothetical protein